MPSHLRNPAGTAIFQAFAADSRQGQPAGMQRPLLAFTAPVLLRLAPAINTVLAACAAAGPAAHHAIHRKRRIALPPAARSQPASLAANDQR
jgi:hypothetical protein